MNVVGNQRGPQPAKIAVGPTTWQKSQRRNAHQPPQQPAHGQIEPARVTHGRDERRRRLRPGAALLLSSSPSEGPSGLRSMRTTGRMMTLAGSELASM